MSRKFWYLTKVSLNKKIKTKWFVITNIIIMLAIISVINIKNLVEFFGGDFNSDKILLVEDNVDAYDVFLKNLSDIDNLEIQKVSNKEKEELTDKEILVILNEDSQEFMTTQIISQEKIDMEVYQNIINALTITKNYVGIKESAIDPEILTALTAPVKVDRVVLSDANSTDENMEIVMNSVFPTLILPFFMLVIFLVQMVGGEICEEKTTRSMEIIIANISPKMHLLSKVVASNIFVIIQGLFLVLYAFLGLFIHKSMVGGTLFGDVFSLLNNINLSTLVDHLGILIPCTVVLMILSFIAYAVVSGILASMTVNIEDFNQLQTPVMLLSVVGYYLAITASMFKGSVLIHVLSYIPFLSAFLSPTLYIIGEISIWEMIISILIMILFIVILLNKGMKIYKNGILNYSTDKVWRRLFKAFK